MEEPEDLVALVGVDEGLEDPEHRGRIHHPRPDGKLPRDLRYIQEQFGERLAPVEPPCGHILPGQLDLVSARCDEVPDGVEDRLARCAHEPPPGKPGDAVTAPAKAPARHLHNADRPRPSGSDAVGTACDLVRVDDVRRADRTNPVHLDDRHAPGHVEVAVGKEGEAPEHLSFGRLDHRAGVDDDGIRLLRPPDPRTAKPLQYRNKPPGIGMVVGAPVTLDIDSSIPQFLKRDGDRPSLCAVGGRGWFPAG